MMGLQVPPSDFLKGIVILIVSDKNRFASGMDTTEVLKLQAESHGAKVLKAPIRRYMTDRPLWKSRNIDYCIWKGDSMAIWDTLSIYISDSGNNIIFVNTDWLTQSIKEEKILDHIPFLAKTPTPEPLKTIEELERLAGLESGAPKESSTTEKRPREEEIEVTSSPIENNSAKKQRTDKDYTSTLLTNEQMNTLQNLITTLTGYM